jgi:DUF4097 and DUF4098 domain-containing protein YvlB
MRKNILAIALITFLLGASCIQAEDRSDNGTLSTSAVLQKDNYRSLFKKQFASSQVKNLDVRTISSDIEVSGDASGSATLEVLVKGPNNKPLSAAEIKSRLDKYYKITDELSGGTLRVKVEHKTSRIPNNQGLNMKFILHTPKSAEASLSAVSGDIELHIAGGASITTTSGDIELSEISGDVKASSVSGDVEARNIKGSFAATSTSGDIEAQGMARLESAMTTSGDIELTTRALANNAKLRSTSGDIKLNVVGNSGIMFKAATVSGDIDLGSVGSVKYETKSKRKVVAQLNGGGQTLSVETVSGDIKISRS